MSASAIPIYNKDNQPVIPIIKPTTEKVNFISAEDKAKLDSLSASGTVQSDWTETDDTKLSYIKNKPVGAFGGDTYSYDASGGIDDFGSAGELVDDIALLGNVLGAFERIYGGNGIVQDGLSIATNLVNLESELQQSLAVLTTGDGSFSTSGATLDFGEGFELQGNEDDLTLLAYTVGGFDRIYGTNLGTILNGESIKANLVLIDTKLKDLDLSSSVSALTDSVSALTDSVSALSDSVSSLTNSVSVLTDSVSSLTDSVSSVQNDLVASAGNLQSQIDTKQPSGSYADTIHTHPSSAITDIDSYVGNLITQAISGLGGGGGVSGETISSFLLMGA